MGISHKLTEQSIDVIDEKKIIEQWLRFAYDFLIQSLITITIKTIDSQNYDNNEYHYDSNDRKGRKRTENRCFIEKVFCAFNPYLETSSLQSVEYSYKFFT